MIGCGFHISSIEDGYLVKCKVKKLPSSLGNLLKKTSLAHP